MYRRFLALVEQNDETALEIFHGLNLSIPFMQAIAIRVDLNFSISPHNDVTLSPRHWPPAFKSSCLDHTKKKADGGCPFAAKLLAYIMQARLADPEFVLHDYQR